MKKAVLVLLAMVCAAASAWAADDPKNLEELLARHLDAIGTADARAKAQSRGISGETEFAYKREQRNERGAGALKMASAGSKLRVVMDLKTQTYYSGEDVTFSGNKFHIAGLAAGRKSALGAFLEQNPAVLNDGLFTGALSTGWVLLDPAARNGKLKYSGRKKIDGQELLELKYEPKKNAEDIVIKMYFDPATCRHVMTVYEARSMMPAGRNETSAVRSMAGEQSSQSHQFLRERFDAFQIVDGITLPTRWSLEIFNDVDMTNILKWESKIQTTVHVPIDPVTFQVN